MEPVKGGTLASLPQKAESLLRKNHPDWTPSDWALRFVQSLPGVSVCLSGMNSAEQMKENIQPFEPLTDPEIALLIQVRQIIESKTAIACTGCQYCVSHCPKKIPVPQYIKMYNELFRYPDEDWKIIPSYHQTAPTNGKASDCISCHSCEKYYPQNLPVAQHMKKSLNNLNGKSFQPHRVHEWSQRQKALVKTQKVHGCHSPKRRVSRGFSCSQTDFLMPQNTFSRCLTNAFRNHQPSGGFLYPMKRASVFPKFIQVTEALQTAFRKLSVWI